MLNLFAFKAGKIKSGSWGERNSQRSLEFKGFSHFIS